MNDFVGQKSASGRRVQWQDIDKKEKRKLAGTGGNGRHGERARTKNAFRVALALIVGGCVILDAGDVLMRPYEGQDRDVLVTILGEPELMRLVLEERPLSKAEADAFIDRHFCVVGHLGYETVTLKSTDEAIGFSGFRACHYLDEDDVEFGWVLSKKHHGGGYATALGERLIRHALQTWQLPRILAACNPLNHASERILRDKLQMWFERQVEPRAGFYRRVYSATTGWSRAKR